MSTPNPPRKGSLVEQLRALYAQLAGGAGHPPTSRRAVLNLEPL